MTCSWRCSPWPLWEGFTEETHAGTPRTLASACSRPQGGPQGGPQGQAQQTGHDRGAVARKGWLSPATSVLGEARVGRGAGRDSLWPLGPRCLPAAAGGPSLDMGVLTGRSSPTPSAFGNGLRD